MQRLTARFLLLFALAGTFVPLALAATTAPAHACCIRKTHHCHEAASPESTQVISATTCCDHDCCRAATTSQWANPQPGMPAVVAQNVEARIAGSQSRPPATPLFASESTRAPPQLSIA